jgi:hypothetical protein
LVFSVFSVSSVVKAFSVSVEEEKAFNTENTEKTEKSSHGSRITSHESRTPMGRTVPTFRQLVDDAIARWAKFRRALRREDQEYFDRLFRRVRSYTQAATYQASDNPMEAILLSIALDHEKRLDAIEHAAPLQVEAVLPPIKIPEQLDAPGSSDENEQPDTQPDAQLDVQPDTNQQLDFHQRMSLRSLPEPAGDDAVADRAEPDAPPAD